MQRGPPEAARSLVVGYRPAIGLRDPEDDDEVAARYAGILVTVLRIYFLTPGDLQSRAPQSSLLAFFVLAALQGCH